MGMHVEHRGGFVNYVSHKREVIVAASPRDDDEVYMSDVHSDLFPDRSFSISAESSKSDAEDWIDFIESPPVVKGVRSQRGDWSNYVKAAVLRLLMLDRSSSIRGMNMTFSGNIPPSSGLSSSSAMVVASALAAMELNGIKIPRERLVELCGEAEWYVGTRGGAGDHAAMLFCRRGMICRLRFFPFKVYDYLPLPKGFAFVLFNSMRSARKAGDVLEAYNQTIVSYQMALTLIKWTMEEMGFPRDLVAETRHLRDINPDRLNLEDIYKVLRVLPERVRRDELLRRFPNRTEELTRLFETRPEPSDGYRIRGVAMFGISECRRGELFGRILKEGRIEEIGRLMLIEHDGDRISRYDVERGIWTEYKNDISDRALDALVQDCRSSEPQRAIRARLEYQPGDFRCSSRELDQMVDVAMSVPGVLGAGLTGAGFGGCIRVLCREDAVPLLIKTMKEKYYSPRGLEPSAEPIQTVEAACVLTLDG